MIPCHIDLNPQQDYLQIILNNDPIHFSILNPYNIVEYLNDKNKCIGLKILNFKNLTFDRWKEIFVERKYSAMFDNIVSYQIRIGEFESGEMV